MARCALILLLCLSFTGCTIVPVAIGSDVHVQLNFWPSQYYNDAPLPAEPAESEGISLQRRIDQLKEN